MSYMVYIGEIERHVVIADHADPTEDPRVRMAARASVVERAVPIEPLCSKRYPSAREALQAASKLNALPNGLVKHLALGERRRGLAGTYKHREYRAIVVREVEIDR